MTASRLGVRRAATVLAVGAAVATGVALAGPATAAASKPTITAKVTSSQPVSQYGWYRKNVKVTFTCTTHGSPLTKPCPKPVTFTASKAHQSVTRIIATKDGQHASVTVKNINIDKVAPTAQTTGMVAGKRYFNDFPGFGCKARDALSGIAACHPLVGLEYHQAVLEATVAAVDRAGNTAYSTPVKAYLDAAYVDDADYNGTTDTYGVKLGHSYTFTVVSTLHPRFVDAAVYPQTPTKRDLYLTASAPHTWTLPVTINNAMRSHAYWNLGVEIAGVVHSVKVHVTK